MSEEEKKAIEDLKHTLKISDELFEEVGDRLIDTRSTLQIETVLNLIEKQDKELEKYKEFYHRRLKEWKKRFENQDKHFLNGLDEYDEERKRLQKEVEKQDKIIDLMAQWIGKQTEDIDNNHLTYCNLKQEYCNDVECKDCIKEYFKSIEYEVK